MLKGRPRGHTGGVDRADPLRGSADSQDHRRPALTRGLVVDPLTDVLRRWLDTSD